MMQLNPELGRKDAIQKVADQKFEIYWQKREYRFRRIRGRGLLMAE
jgi:hypothetical protein